MKTIRKKINIMALLLTVLVMMTAGCASGEKAKEEEKPEAVLYPVSIDGTEIRVGETTVQALLDKGLKVTVSEMTPDKQFNEYEIDPEEMLEANSYYSGASRTIMFPLRSFQEKRQGKYFLTLQAIKTCGFPSRQ